METTKKKRTREEVRAAFRGNDAQEERAHGG